MRRVIDRVWRPMVTLVSVVGAWWALVVVTGLPAFLLPSPDRVALALIDHAALLNRHGAVTAAEIALGLITGTLLGVASALTLAYFRGARRWLMPVLVASQAVPVFALAPLLTLWLGYDMAPKVAMAALIIFFPVTGAFFDGLRRTEPGWLDLARTMGASRWTVLLRIRVPAALPALASGLRVATAFAPIGAVVGEWVGSSAGLGFLMLHANGRMKTDLMFAALLVLVVISLSLYFLVDRGLKRALPWQPDTAPTDDAGG